MATNIRFNYLYRDSGNWKKFGHKDYSNPDNLTIEDTERQLRQCIISSEFFFPEQAGITKFRFHRYHDDYSWYEFESLEPVAGRWCSESFGGLVELLKKFTELSSCFL
jgi:hypothetical protein